MKATRVVISVLLHTFFLGIKCLSAFTIPLPSPIVSTTTNLYSTTDSSSSSSTPFQQSQQTSKPVTISKQPEYGKTLEMPGTYVRCGRCGTSYAIAASDLGDGKGRRVECALCSHSWFQTSERLFTLNNGHELVPLPSTDIDRITSNIKNGRDPDYAGNLKFYVGNLAFTVEEDNLRDLFATIGEVGSVNIITGPDGRSKGFAFVTMIDDSVKNACLELDGKDLMGRNINVKEPNN